MKTRSNDIIPNVPFSYNSSTNTFEIGTNLYVNGSIKTQDAIMLYYDTQLTFYSEKENSKDITISPLFGDTESITQLSFIYTLPDGTESYSAYLDLDKSSNILTDKNTKTLFGNQNLRGSGNIDLYKHYLTIDVKDEASNITDTFSILVQSSSNVDCSSATGATQKLKDLLKASGSSIKTYEYGPNNDSSSVGMLLWTGTILCITASGGEFNIVKIVDRVETL